MMEKGITTIPISVALLVNKQKTLSLLADLDTPTLISLFKGEGDSDVRQAMAPELTKCLEKIKNSFNLETI